MGTAVEARGAGMVEGIAGADLLHSRAEVETDAWTRRMT